MSKSTPNLSDRIWSDVRKTLGPEWQDVQLVPANRLGRAISKLAPNLGVRAYINVPKRTIVVFTYDHWYQYPCDQFFRPDLMNNVHATAYAIVQSTPQLRERIGGS